MSAQKNLTEEELNRLIEILSQRKEENEGKISLAQVRTSLTQLNLSNFCEEDDIEKVQKQVAREMRRRQLRNYSIFGLIIAIIIAPLSAYGGFKLKELLSDRFPGEEPQKALPESTEDKEKIAELKIENDALKRQVEELTKENEELETKTPLVADSIDLDNPLPVPDQPISRQPGSKQSFEVQDLTFELQSCRKSSTAPSVNSISCRFLITSKKDKAEVYLYAGNNNRRSRIIEQGQEYLSTKVEIGSAVNNYSVSNILIKDAPMSAKITFDNIPLEIEKIGVLSVDSYLRSSDYDNDINIEFRDISIL